MTKAQRRALETLLPCYGVNAELSLLDLDAVFGRRAPRLLEIGFGRGDALLATAVAHPDYDLLGVEVYRPGVGNLLLRLEAQELANVRVICNDAVEVFKRQIPDASLDAVHLFFPDPWPKKRHRKRRIVQAPFVTLVGRCLKVGGRLHMATDWEDYADQMMEVATQAPAFANVYGNNTFAQRPASRPLTKFEQRGERLGHKIWDLIFERIR
jgi:tRNA (guanine-N(7)-)-methyltransferase